ncbi:Monothiol glutaredoxin-S15, mitochondrial isoform B [Glycine soja]|uniref:Monothiol glutaredoxin-S15, mitochondrial isoform B n=1 Tax=Glycine soja TaxID=3848 RepID=A0A445IFV1_GLYSO|nr:Monothiol glutaredoxin-S15, mitochondrial isoform B [Glycine soja]
MFSFCNSICLPLMSSQLTRSCYHGMRYFATVSNDPDTHDDFKPANKLENSNISLADVIEQDVKDNPVMIYMKGVPDFPLCGFSSLAVRVLQQYDVPLSARNILEDPELKNAVKAFSNWPTFPQVFIKGEFIGGSDIVLNMHQVNTHFKSFYIFLLVILNSCLTILDIM